MADQAIYAPMVVLDANGLPVAGARVFFYASGTNTLIDIYADEDGTTLATNPVVADGAGYLPQRFFNGDARAVIQTPNGETIRTIDPVPKSISVASAAANVSFAPTLNIPQLDVQSALEAVDTNARTREADVKAAAQPLNANLTSLAGISRAEGDLIRGGASGWERLAIGTTGRLIRSTGTTAAWDDPVKVSASQAATGAVPLAFNDIPAWANVIIVALNNVSLSGTDDLIVQLGTSSSFVSTGYEGGAVYLGANILAVTSTSGFMVRLSVDTRAAVGSMTISRLSGNTWVASHSCFVVGGPGGSIGAGSIALDAALTQLRVTVTGPDSFDTGTVSVSWF